MNYYKHIPILKLDILVPHIAIQLDGKLLEGRKEKTMGFLLATSVPRNVCFSVMEIDDRC